MSTFTELQPAAEVAVPLDPPATSASETGATGAGTAAAAAGAMARLAGAMPSADTVKGKLAEVWSRSRAWSEFANTSQMTRPEPAEVLDRIKENMEHYAFNYMVILLVASALTVMTSPLAFLGGIFIALAYCYLFFLNPEAFKVAGVTLDNNFKAAVILLFSLVILWLTGAGAAFTGLVVFVGIVAIGHATFRKPPGEADFDTAYTPATV